MKLFLVCVGQIPLMQVLCSEVHDMTNDCIRYHTTITETVPIIQCNECREEHILDMCTALTLIDRLRHCFCEYSFLLLSQSNPPVAKNTVPIEQFSSSSKHLAIMFDLSFH